MGRPDKLDLGKSKADWWWHWLVRLRSYLEKAIRLKKKEKKEKEGVGLEDTAG